MMKIVTLTAMRTMATAMRSKGSTVRGSIYRALANDSFFLTNIVLVFIFNIIDAIFTPIWLRLELAKEANPIMDWIYLNWGETAFVAVKIFVCSIALYILWQLKDRILAKIMIVPISLLYSIIAALHVWGWLYL